MNEVDWAELPKANPGHELAEEWNTYRKEIGRMLSAGHEGEFVLIKAQSVIGIFKTIEAAFAVGYQNFLRQPFLVHEIEKKEQLLRMRGVNPTWPSSDIPLAKPA